RERFVSEMEVEAGGSASDALLGGTLMVSGRLHLNPANGCPVAVPTVLDKDPADKILCDLEFKDTNDVDRIVLRVGHAHAIGVIDIISNGNTNKVLIPHMQLSIRRGLAGS